MSDTPLESRLATVREFAQTSPYYQPMGMSLADGSMGNALRTLNGADAQVLTAEVHLHYLRPVRSGSLLAEGRVIQSGRRLSFAEVEIREESSGKPVARGSGVFVIDRSTGSG